MRTRISQVMTFLAVVSFSAACMTGCQTSSGFKAPSTNNWFSWGKKKPASSSFASTKPDTNLPAPPSSTMTPNPASGYAQSPATRPGAGANAWSTTPNATAQANPVSYGQRPDNSGYYSNAGYNMASGYGAGQGGGAPAAGGQPAGAAAQGFYNNYQNSRGAAPADGGYAGSAGAPAGAARGYSDPYGGQPSAGSLGPGSYATGPARQAWTGNDAGSASGSASRSSAYDQGGQYNPAGGSFAPTARGSSYDRGQQATGDGGYGSPRSDSSSFGGAYSGNQTTPSYAGSAAPTANMAGGLNSGGYRPGSTGRPTQFGTSDNINVGAADSVRRASFAGGNENSTRAPAGDSAQPSGGDAPRTATGSSSYSYPSSYDR